MVEHGRVVLGEVVAHACRSLDGFIADPHEEVGPRFDWYGNGDAGVSDTDTERVFRTTEASADAMRAAALVPHLRYEVRR